MSLISCQSISKTFGARPLFENLSLTIDSGERIGLIGPNGAGKSTLIEILAGVQNPDEGIVTFRKGLHLAYVRQEAKFEPGDTVRSVIEGAILSEHKDHTEREGILNLTAGRAGFADFEAPADKLSGGWKKRLSIACELAREPDVLLMDEPTNHLDLEGIVWLEKLVRGLSCSSLIVSHDRYFLENIASDMAEVNRIYPDGIYRAHGSYSDFLLQREDFLHAQSKQLEALENQVRREVVWLRRGAKARTSKSKARIDMAGRLIGDLADLQERTATGIATVDFLASGRKTKKLLTAEVISKSMGGRVLFDKLNISLRPGMRLGLVGPNGSGKTTLLRILAGQLAPDGGTVERADGLRVVYFEQNRDNLDPEITLRRAMCPHGDSVIYRDKPVHIVGWAKRFLFRTEQLDMPVGKLSGGERARLLIARLMLEPADLLMLDEPTNDLDISTLEVLEESLLEFTGSLVLVTHDRYMLDRVSTTVLGLDGRGGVGLFADYTQWEEARVEEAKEKKPEPLRPSGTTAPSKKRLSYNEQREWDSMETAIETAEAIIAKAENEVEAASLAGDPTRLQTSYTQLEAAQAELDRLYARWGQLGEKQG